MSTGIRIAAWLAWPVFAVVALFLLLLAFVAAVSGCTPDCDYVFDASEARAIKLAYAVESFRIDCGRLPDQLDEMFGVVRNDECTTYWMTRASELRDEWGSRFVYWRSDDGTRFEVRGLGRDRVYGSADDVTSSDWSWPWPRPQPPFWRRPPWNCAIATLPWFSIPLGPPLWLMAAIVRRIRRTARQVPAVANR